MGEHTGRMVSEHMARQAARGSANDRQIGGSHYGGEYQHWDFVREVLGNNYLMGNATKYISRWRKKNGLEDLRKSLHYIDKASEHPGIRPFGSTGEPHIGPGGFYVDAVLRFCASCGCGMKEAQAIWKIACAEWDAAAAVVKELIAVEEALPSRAG